MQAEDIDMYYLSGVQVYRGMCRPPYMERILWEFAYTSLHVCWLVYALYSN